MTVTGRPIVRALSGTGGEALLLGNNVGRIAYAHRDRVDVEPIRYVYESPWIWESVVVKGPFSPHNSPLAGWDYDVALAALRRLIPATLTSSDPSPHRDIVFGIHASEISGRCSVANDAVGA